MTHTTHTQSFQVNFMSSTGKISVLLSALLVAGLAHAQLAIQSITTAVQGGAEVIRIQTTEPIKQAPGVFAIQSPARISLDFAGATNGLGRNLVEVNQGNVRSANVVEAGERTRVVLNLNKSVKYETKIDGNSLLVMLEAPAIAYQATTVAKTMFASTGGDVEVQPLADIDFRRGSDNAGRVVVNLASSQTGVDIRPQGKSLVVEFMKTSLPEGLRRRLDVSDFGTPVKAITTSQSGDRVRMVVEPTGNWEHSAYQSDNQFVLEVREVKVDPKKLTGGVGYTGEKLSLNFQNIEVRSLLQVIGDFTNFNIVTSDSVTGNVTLRLKDVPWDQAMDIILQAKGLGMRKNGNVIWVAPKDELAAREKADFEAAAQVQILEPVKTQTFQVNYSKASELAKLLMGSADTIKSGSGMRVLSPRGSAMAEQRTNQLFVTDVSAKLEEVALLIKKLDIPVRQVMIEARIVEADEKFGKSLGVKFGYSGNGKNSNVGGTYSDVTSSSTASASSPFVSLPAAAQDTTSAANFAFSLFNSSKTRMLGLEISALQAENQGKVISSPRLITADQIKALIEQGVEIPYTESASSGAATISFKKAVLKLEVTPQITPEGGIILDVEVSKDSPNETLVTGAGSQGNAVAINTNKVKTQVLVDNGGTVVIGGIFTSTEQNDDYKVPMLGDIPVLGNLFKSRSRSTEKKELLVFLTPRVLNDGASVVR